MIGSRWRRLGRIVFGEREFIKLYIGFELGEMETIIRRSECFREIRLLKSNCVPLVKPSENRLFRQMEGLLLWIDEEEVMLPG